MRVTVLLCLFIDLCAVVYAASAQQPLLHPNDRVALVGGTFFERMQSTGALEAEIHCRRPEWKLSFRNLGWSGDDVHGIARKRFGGPEDGFERLLQDIETANPTVIVIAYGFAEASDGMEAVKRFESGLTRLIAAVATGDRRVVLVSPIAMPGYRTDDYDEAMRQCQRTVQQVADRSGTPAVSIDWRPSDTELNEQQLLPNEYGYQQFASRLADRLVGGQPCEAIDETLRAKIVEKNQWFFHRYRPQNETYLFLFRKHEQGNNAIEIPRFDPLIKQADEAIWKSAASSR